MTITSLEFAAFALITLVIYYALPPRPQNMLLLGLSYVFYATWSWSYALILAGMTLVNFGLARAIVNKPSPRRAIMILGVVFNLAVLALFKYEAFFVPDLRAQLDEWSISTGLGSLDVLLPVGLSFYVLGLIAYLIDIGRGQASAPDNLLDFALYVAYFPKLIAGPIERAQRFMPQLAAPRTVDDAALARSAGLIALGVARKALIADMLFLGLPDDLWTAPGDYSALRLIVYLLVYGIALYNDFAGYTSLVRGISGLFGIELARNFDLPYTARNFTEFWNRWHITLSVWLRDYVYFPISRALLRRNPRRTNVPNMIFPAMATMLVSGLWHGPGWAMLLWGALHGLYLVGERVLAVVHPTAPPDRQPLWRQIIGMGLVFGLVMLAWVPFRAPDIPTALKYWAGMLDLADLSQRPSPRLLIILLPALALDWVQYRAHDELVMLRWPRWVQAALIAGMLLALFLLAQADTGVPFVYQGF